MCKTRTIASTKNVFIFSLNDQFLRWSPRSPPKGTLEVPDVRTFRGTSGNIPGMSRSGWQDRWVIIFIPEKLVWMILK